MRYKQETNNKNYIQDQQIKINKYRGESRRDKFRGNSKLNIGKV